MSSEKQGMSRRSFLSKTAAVTTAGALFAGTRHSVQGQVIGANDTINIAVMGIRSRGQGHISNFAEMDNVRVTWLCDVDEKLFPDRVKIAEDLQGSKPKTAQDIREVLEDDELDAVSMGTPNHWHALGTIWAAQAGKHVYVEKPASHNIWEGRKMVDAARKYNVLVQVGFQNRSRNNTNAAMKFLHDGGLGEIYMARGLCFKPRGDIGRPQNAPVPEGLDYDLWLGPAQERPFNPNYVHYNWHWHWAFGNGDTGNQGPHQFDIAKWGLGKDWEYPVKVKSVGGYYVYDSTQETPNTQTTLLEYADGKVLEFSTRGLATNEEGDQMIGDIFYGSEGWMEIDAGGNWQVYFGRDGEEGPSSGETSEEEYDAMNLAGTGGGGHFGNFIAAVRSGNREDLTCDIEVGHRSTVLPELGNISYRLGRELAFDGLSETFVDDPEADKMLTRNYREPFVVPERV